MEFMKSFTWSTFISNGRLKKKGERKQNPGFYILVPCLHLIIAMNLTELSSLENHTLTYSIRNAHLMKTYLALCPLCSLFLGLNVYLKSRSQTTDVGSVGVRGVGSFSPLTKCGEWGAISPPNKILP